MMREQQHNRKNAGHLLSRWAVPDGSVAEDAPSPEDMERIGTLAPGRIAPGDVYVRSMYLCSDRVCPADWGKFTENALRRICCLVVGRAVLRGHDRSSLPLARFYRAEVVERDGETDPETGEPVRWVRAWFYWLRGTTGARDLLLNIDGGVYREVSISWRYRGATCSVCGDDIRSCEHTPGRTYDGTRCHFAVDEVLDVLEGSLVYRGAESRASLAGARGSLHDDSEDSTPGCGEERNGSEDSTRGPVGPTGLLTALSTLPRTIRSVVMSGELCGSEAGLLKRLALWVRLDRETEAGPGSIDQWSPGDTERVDLWIVRPGRDAASGFRVGGDSVPPRADRVLLLLVHRGKMAGSMERRGRRWLQGLGYLPESVRRSDNESVIAAERIDR